VVFAHGIRRGPGRGDGPCAAIASHVLAGGYAWIASGYRAREYRARLLIEDLVARRELFLEEIGPPRWSIIYGQSMGGHTSVASLELRPGLSFEDLVAGIERGVDARSAPGGSAGRALAGPSSQSIASGSRPASGVCGSGRRVAVARACSFSSARTRRRSGSMGSTAMNTRARSQN
jgi:hypothetical protein